MAKPTLVRTSRPVVPISGVTVEVMLEQIFNTSSENDVTRARGVIGSLTPFERDLVIRLVIEEETLASVALNLHASEARVLKTLSTGLSKLCKGRGIPALCRLVGRAKELGLFVQAA